MAVFLHWLTGGVGITLGVHRLITHHSFQPPILCARLKATAGSGTQKGIGLGDGSFPSSMAGTRTRHSLGFGRKAGVLHADAV